MGPVEVQHMALLTSGDIRKYDTACDMLRNENSVTISEDGSVTYVGYDNVEKMGTVEYSITKSEVSSIVEKIHNAGFYGLEDEYEPNITDVPRIIISTNLDGDSRSVESISCNARIPEEDSNSNF